MIRTNFLKSLFAVAIIVCVFTSCTKEEILGLDNTTPAEVLNRIVDPGETNNVDPVEDNEDDECFDIVFPVTVMLADGRTETIDNSEDLHLLEESLEDGEGEDEDDDGNEDGEDNDEEGEDDDEEGEDDDEEGEDDDEEGEDDDDEEGDDDDEEGEDDDEDGEDNEEDDGFSFVFPIEVVLEDGSTTSIDSEDALEMLEDSCED